jgi:SAM-dependent methyltransferase
MHQNSKLLFEKYAKGLIQPGSTVLEVGPDKVPSTYMTLTGYLPGLQWHTVDINPAVQTTFVAYGEYVFGIKSEGYDVVLSGQVIEHVRKIWRWMPEVARVCKPGGLVITINPVSWEYHTAPYDCWRIYPDGMRALYEDAGLEVIMSEFESLSDDGVIDTITIGRKTI